MWKKIIIKIENIVQHRVSSAYDISIKYKNSAAHLKKKLNLINVMLQKIHKRVNNKINFHSLIQVQVNC